jgi:hypothetical protein
VTVSGGTNLQAYARYMNDTAILIIPNNNNTSGTFTVNIPFAAMNIIDYNNYTLTDAETGQAIVSGSQNAVNNFQITVPSNDMRIIKVTASGQDGTKYECESLTASTNGPATGNYSFDYCSNGQYSKLSSTSVNDYVSYTVNIPEAGTYNVRVMTVGHTSRGKFKLFIPETNSYLGSEQDQYCTQTGVDSERMMQFDYGNVTFSTPGNKEFKFIVTGKNSSSSGYTLCFDYIKLIKS